MSAPAPERLPALERLPVLTGVMADLNICHEICCDDNQAVCGQDVSAEPWAPDNAETTCPLCALDPRCHLCGSTA